MRCPQSSAHKVLLMSCSRRWASAVCSRSHSEPEPEPRPEAELEPQWRPPEPEIVRVFSAEPAEQPEPKPKPEGKGQRTFVTHKSIHSSQLTHCGLSQSQLGSFGGTSCASPRLSSSASVARPAAVASSAPRTSYVGRVSGVEA